MTDLEWQPAFKGQRPPFQPGNTLGATTGNTLAMKSGVWSARIIDPIADEYRERLFQDPSTEYLRETRYQFAVNAWSRAEAQLARMSDHIAGMTMDEQLESSQGRTSPAEQLRKFDSAAMNHRNVLGLTPLAAARLNKDVSASRTMDTARVMAELEAIERRTTGGKAT